MADWSEMFNSDAGNVFFNVQLRIYSCLFEVAVNKRVILVIILWPNG